MPLRFHIEKKSYNDAIKHQIMLFYSGTKKIKYFLDPPPQTHRKDAGIQTVVSMLGHMVRSCAEWCYINLCGEWIKYDRERQNQKGKVYGTLISPLQHGISVTCPWCDKFLILCFYVSLSFQTFYNRQMLWSGPIEILHVDTLFYHEKNSTQYMNMQ